MHPINKTNFGTKGVQIRYYNGSSVVTGYIVKQLGVYKYLVTDGTNPKICTLAQTSAQVSGLGSSTPTICTIPVSGSMATARGATFTPTFALDATTSVNSGGSGYTNGDSLTISGATRATGSITIGASNAAANNTVVVNGTTITFVTGTPSGAQVQIGGSSAATATALYNYLTTNVNTQLSYYVVGSTVNIYAKADGTAANAFTLVAGGGATTATVSVSGATLTGGTVAVAGTPSVITTSVTGGAVVGVATVGTAGAWTTLPSGPVTGYYATNGRAPATFTARYKVASIAASGGSGYAVSDNLSFSGMGDQTSPAAHISALSGSAPSTVVVDSGGSGITSAGTVGVLGTTEHARVLYDTRVQTVEGNRYFWTLGNTVNGSAAVNTYS